MNVPRCYVIRTVPVLCCHFTKQTLSGYTATQTASSTKPRECIPCEATSINFFIFIYLFVVYLTNLSVSQDYRAEDKGKSVPLRARGAQRVPGS
jgi:hypothetical protein